MSRALARVDEALAASLDREMYNVEEVRDLLLEVRNAVEHDLAAAAAAG